MKILWKELDLCTFHFPLESPHYQFWFERYACYDLASLCSL
jgi:hypothetical protein